MPNPSLKSKIKNKTNKNKNKRGIKKGVGNE